MANYKTPGVYVEEITKFPPSVAQVETAIPAFIGYTEKAEKLNGDSLHLKPTRITSLLEYETYFGSASPEKTIIVEMTDVLSDSNTLTDRTIKVHQPSSKSPFLSYYALQIYFANGGGPCYITSVDQYGRKSLPASSVKLSDLEKGLAEIEKQDEPTLLIFPDAVNLPSDSDFWGIYDAALKQCNKLQDRFTIIDTYRDSDYTETSSSNTVTPAEGLRNGVTLGKDYIKYGAAYYPYLETILNYQYNENEVTINHFSINADAYDKIEENLVPIENVVTGIPGVVGDLFDYTTPGSDGGDISGLVSDVFLHLYDDMDLGGTFTTSGVLKDDLLTKTQSLIDKLSALNKFKADLKIEAKAAASTIKDEDSVIEAAINGHLATFIADFEGDDKLEGIQTKLEDLYVKIQKAASSDKLKKVLSTEAVNLDGELKKILTYTPLNTQTAVDEPTVNLLDNVSSNMSALTSAIKSVDGHDKNNGEFNGRSLASLEAEDNTVYNKIKVAIDGLPLTLPPSSTMAGIYARVDAARGVWKAPANVGLSYVIKPTVQISHEEQGDLNIHTTGKSINAIRTFTGKGTLVWGARTLAGNDNEWRYIPVRRFFNMVEESVSKATEQFVFEGNDSGTWVRVRAMIENFLILQWKAGALTGSKAEQAFYVRVGLGQTMTAQDILEGRMIVEIGMAVVRPAEFIILRFSHKMQEA